MHRTPAVLAAALALGLSLPVHAAGPKVEVVKGDFRFAPAGYVQGDFRSFHDWEAGDEDTGNLRGETRELRRLRVGFELEYKWFAFELDVDPHADGDELKDLYADLQIHDAFRIRGGHFKLPVSPEFLTSAARTDFIERSLLADTIGPDRDWGVMVHGRADRLGYDVGVFRGDNRTSATRADWTGAARVTFELAKALDLGASFAQGRVDEDPSDDPVAKGMQGAGAAGFEFYDRHFVDGTRRRLGADLKYTPGPLGLKAEYLEGREERRGQGSTFDDLPDQVARGWAASATLLLTGDAKKARIEPKRPFPHGPGAIEIGVRYEDLRFDDDGDDTGFSGAGDRARNIRPAADRVLTGGLSWWPVHYVRFMGNVAVERYLDPLLAPEPGRRGNYVTLLFRAQLQVP
ncbi:MAG: porin [Vicinamibacteria bacterium]